MSHGDGRYVSRKSSDSGCEAKDVGRDGVAEECDRQPVWELEHSNGCHLHICEYHVECYRNYTPAFREAIREIWPDKS